MMKLKPCPFCGGDIEERGGQCNYGKKTICKFIYYSNNDDFNYCPNCGAKMTDNKGEINK